MCIPCFFMGTMFKLIYLLTSCVFPLLFQNSRYGSSRYSEPSSTSPYDTTSSSRYGSSRTDRPSSYSGTTYSRSYTSSSVDSEKGGIDYKKVRQCNEKQSIDLKRSGTPSTHTLTTYLNSSNCEI